MTKRLFEIYLAVCEKESMTAAAEELEMSQPAVSSAVSQLEKTYETRLFARHGKTIELTESGRRLRQYAETILSQYDKAWQALHEEEKGQTITIGLTPSSADTVLAYLAERMEDENITWLIRDAAQLTEMLKDHQIDLALADLNADESGLTYLPVYKEELCAVASPEYMEDDTLSSSALPETRLLLRPQGSGSRAAIEASFARRSIKLTPYIEADSDLTLIRMAENGLGVAVVPEKLIEKSLRKKRLKTLKIKGADLRRQYYLIYRSDIYMDEHLSQLIRNIRTYAKKGLDA